MYEVLIVDDEAHAVLGVQTGVKWERFPVSRIHVAYNIRQAKEIIEASPIQLMICDIEMPQGTGLDLLNWVKAQQLQIETIFLTCHADFSYAQKALSLGSFHYLLKPVDFGELESSLEKALDKIHKERQLESFENTHKHYLRLWESRKPMVMETFWRDLIREVIPSSPEHISPMFQKYDISLEASTKFLPVYIRVQTWHQPFTTRDERILEYALQNAAQEFLVGENADALVISLDNHKLLSILPQTGKNTNSEDELFEIFKKFISYCNHYFYCDVNCFIGNEVFAHEMRNSVSKLKNIDENYIAEANKVFVIARMKRSHSPIQLPPVRDWSDLLKQGAKDRLIVKLKEYLDKVRHELNTGGAQWMEFFYQDFIQMIFFVLHVKGLQAHQVFSQSLLTDRPTAAFRSLKAMEEWLVYVTEVTANYISSSEQNESIVQKVMKYVHENIEQQHLSRDDIAQYVYLNPDYLTRVFKKETGLSITDFLQQQKIEYAKRLLIQTDLTVNEVAMTVGYSNLSYFSTLFKKIAFMNPADFRKQYKGNFA
ncbi:helix-turn-helix domain-containing protein [Cohnella sp. WQ 127256]|uniref:response regulator transcription factor n=1 Tax=Cohnella sp. WQ 127256 TaxID=2938790 RepID=UPI002117E352|nr:helix-turn-helix domain-containing protein [Cohnella sp. WQ 127256]